MLSPTHKSLEYLSPTRMLTRHQARWSEYLSTFNRVIHFRPGQIGEKLDSLTQRVDYYLKRGDRDSTLAILRSIHPVFFSHQLTALLSATYLHEVILDALSLVDSTISIIDAAALLEDIKSGYSVDPLAKREINLCLEGNPSPRFSLSLSGLLLLMDCRVYVPDYRPEQGNLRTRVLQENHDHPTAGHFGYKKTLELLRRDYIWPSMRSDCKKFVSQCVLGSLLRMRLYFTSRHHPSANGQVERVNSTLEQYLRIYCNYEQDNWSKLLPLAEFAYNNAPNASTGVSILRHPWLRSAHRHLPRCRSHRFTSMTLCSQL